MREQTERYWFCSSLLLKKENIPRTTTVKSGEFVYLAKILLINRTYRWTNNHYPGQSMLTIAQRQ